jgi:hypothetical protein
MLLVMSMGPWRSIFLYLLILLSSFFNVFPFPPSTDKVIGDFHVIRRFNVFFILKSNFHMVKRTVLLDVRITFITFYLFMYIVQFGTATCVFSEDFRVRKAPTFHQTGQHPGLPTAVVKTQKGETSSCCKTRTLNSCRTGTPCPRRTRAAFP